MRSSFRSFLGSLFSQFLAYRVFPPPAGAAAFVCGLRAENHMLFVLFVAAVFHVTLTTCWKRTEKETTNVYNHLQVVFVVGL